MSRYRIHPDAESFHRSQDVSERRARRLLAGVLSLSLAAALAQRIPLTQDYRAILAAPLEPALLATGKLRHVVENIVRPVSPAPEELLVKWEARAAFDRAQAAKYRRELDELRGLMSLRSDSTATGRMATVLLDPMQLGFQTIVIDAGRRDGIREGAVVLSAGPKGAAVVGRVDEIGIATARVRTVRDASLRIAVTLSGEPGFVHVGSKRGSGGRLEFVPMDRATKPDEEVHTSPDGEIFPAGLLMGHVRSVRNEGGAFQTVEIRHAVDLEHLKHVWVAGAER